MKAAPQVSIIIPVYNEIKNIRPIYGLLSRVFDDMGKSYEIIFVDDGSTDGTLTEIEALCKKDKHVRYISFSKNFRKAAALSAGFSRARGEYILTLDGDLQEDPRDIPRFFEKLSRGYDMVIGWKYRRRDSILKRIPSWIFNFLLRSINNVNIHDCDCNFRLMKRQVIDALDLYGGMYRFIPILAKNAGFRVGEVKINHRPRRHGKSKYGMSRIFTGFFDFITISFLRKYLRNPLHFFGFVGFFLFGWGMVFGLYLFYIRIVQNFLFGIPPVYIGGRPLLFLVVLLLILGFQFVSLGLIGELLVSLYSPRQKKYMIKKETSR